MAAELSRMPAGYEFLRTLGRGGSGWVALAQQTTTGRQVAVKILYGGSLDAQGHLRLRREGQALARLAHPNIAKVFDLVSVDEDLALILEYVPGFDLANALDRGQVDLAGRLSILTGVASALDHASAIGITHRDVKPANVVVSSTDGAAKVIDFGIARLARTSASFRSSDGFVRGTMSYMSPEQIIDPDDESPAADAYSFAVLTYELLVGRPPFIGPPHLVKAGHLYEPPPTPTSIQPLLPVLAGKAILMGLAKSPEQRISATALVERLQAVPPAQWRPLAERMVARNLRHDDPQPITEPSTTDAVPWLTPPGPRSRLRLESRSALWLIALVAGILAGSAIGVAVAVLTRM